MRKILFFLFIISLTSCKEISELKTDNYNQKTLVTDKTPNKVWVSIIDFLSYNDIPIKLISKQNGIIITDKISFINNWSYETNNELDIKDSYIVVQKHYFENTIQHPTKIIGEWVITIKEIDNKTTININLSNVEAIHKTTSEVNYIPTDIPLYVKSTGVFEKQILDRIK